MIIAEIIIFLLAVIWLVQLVWLIGRFIKEEKHDEVHDGSRIRLITDLHWRETIGRGVNENISPAPADPEYSPKLDHIG